MNKYYFLLIPVLFIPIFILAQNLDSVSYPIEELGGCQNREECKDFCDKILNTEACLEFSRKNDLLLNLSCDSVDIRTFADNLKKGVDLLPCETKAECLDYCAEPTNLEQCLVFAEKSGILSRYQALLLKRTKGIGPGQCKSEQECKDYCGKAENVDECLAFAKNLGFMSQEQVAEAIRLRDIALQGGPGECVGLKECRQYCSIESNFQECINFGKETGIINQEQAELMEEFVQQGGPGGCKTSQECLQFCQGPENTQQCFSYMVENGYLPEEAIESLNQRIEEMQESIDEQIEEFKKNFDFDEEDEEKLRKQIEERLEPYKDLLK